MPYRCSPGCVCVCVCVCECVCEGAGGAGGEEYENGERELKETGPQWEDRFRFLQPEERQYLARLARF